jgi:hypothetical protein
VLFRLLIFTILIIVLVGVAILLVGKT